MNWNISKKEICPWWNTLTEEEKMGIYFKYFTSGTLDDCNDWWWNMDLEDKIKVFNREEKDQNVK